MEKYTRIKALFESAQNTTEAESMAKYMKGQFPFYGIPSPERKALYKDFLKEEKKGKAIDWGFLDKCYEDEHREFQYLVSDYLFSMRKYASFEDIEKIRRYIVTKSWWDTVDFLCKVIGDIGLRDERVKGLMLEWAQNGNIWIRRSAILHQLAYKEKTDTALLESIILSCTGTGEFFINKAIGWALREYSKTNAEWVRGFITQHRDSLHSLSIKEGSKFI